MKGILAVAFLLCVALMAGCTSPSGPTQTLTETGSPAPGGLLCSYATWDDPCTTLASPNDSPSKAEIDLAVNPTDPLNVFVASKDLDRKASTDCVWAVGQYTKDGGASWRTTYVGKSLAERGPADILSGWKCITDPILQFEPDGTLHYSLQAYRYEPLPGVPSIGIPVGSIPPEMGFMFQAVSHDGGASFPDIFLLHGGDGNVVFHDYMRMGHNPRTGTIFTIWNQLGPGLGSVPVVVAVRSGMTSAMPPYYFPKDPAATPGDVSLGESSIVGDSQGKVYAWLAGFNSPGEAWFATSLDDGVSWSNPAKAFDFTPMGDLATHKFANGTSYDPKYRTGTSVELVVDTSGGPRDGCLYAVWADGSGAFSGNGSEGSDPADIVSRSSCDGGVTWSPMALVSTGAHGDAQWMPRASVDGNGTLHVVYLTRAHSAGHNFVDAERAVAHWGTGTGNMTWTTQRITAASFDANLGIHQDGFPFIGDYIGAGSSGRDTYLGFPDCHTGRCEIAVAHVRT